ncbi:putative mitochondrial protein [Vitis vinifera]|uniref:Putative mitochondrial protein n=1 Tax=Vitis vinifera TaxID=29760 RepID=A0A438IR75_VITVI|nr:putative mitochondrial protein [Vitis vinifera]
MEKNRSFPIVFKYVENVALRMEDVEEAWLWHRRFGHLNFNSLKMLCQRKMVQGLPNAIEEKNEVCDGCALGKHHRQSFPKGVRLESKKVLECPTKALLNKTPIEAWSGRKPSVRHFKVFGCLCYSQVPKERRSKLDETSEKCIFMGYSSQSKGYRLYNLKTNKLIISRDVIFDEKAAWNWEEVSNFKLVITILNSKKNEKFDYVYERCNLCIVEPQSFEEAIKDEDWRKAMEKEIDVIEKNETWQLVEKPKDKEIIGVKWIFRVKYHSDGRVQRLKARLVAKGYSQQPGVDFHETFAPVAP